MNKITKVDITMVDLAPKVRRLDAIQSFVSQQTPIVTITDSEGVTGTGYCYTIGTGGHAILSLLRTVMAPLLIGKDPARIEGLWRDMLLATHSTAVGAITSLAQAAVDTALWDMHCKRAGLPLWKAAGGSKTDVPLYTTEGGWLQLEAAQLVDDALAMQAQGFKGSKIKIGKPHISEDSARLAAMRAAVGDGYELMVDANQSLSLSEAIRRAAMLQTHGVAWLEEPMRADDVGSHVRLAQSTSVPIAVGESMYSISQFKEYLTNGAAAIVQVDVARIGGITPWLKVAHMAEAYNVMVCPHFLMELHLPLVCAVPNAPWLEYIPQLDSITNSGISITDGRAEPSDAPGLGIDWDWAAIKRIAEVSETVTSS